MVFGKDVTVQTYRFDKYGRTIGDILLPDGMNVNSELVKAGLAWRYVKYSKDERLIKLEAHAKAAKRGFWIEADPVPPWEYRHSTRQGLTESTLEPPVLPAPPPITTSDNPAPIIGNPQFPRLPQTGLPQLHRHGTEEPRDVSDARRGRSRWIRNGGELSMTEIIKTHSL